MNGKTNRIARKSHPKGVARLLCGASFAVMAVALPSTAQAQDQDRWWDANGAQPGAGGTGDWNTTDPVWSEANSDVLGPYRTWVNNAANPDNAIFGVSAVGVPTTVGTITLTEPINVHNITAQAVHNWVIAGGTLTLGGTTPTITTHGNTTINSVIAGTAGLTKAGAGALFLNGTNTFSGGISINLGSIYADDDAALGNLGNNVTTAASTTVRLAIGGAGTSRTVTIGNGGTLIAEGTGMGSALITGDGNVSVAVGVTMSNAASTYTGTTTFGACNGVCTTSFASIADIGVASALGAPTAGNSTITWNQSSQYGDYLIYTGDGDSSNRAWVFNAGSGGIFRNMGSGTLSLSGAMAATGNVQFLGETADIVLSGIISGNSIVRFGGLSGHSVTVTGANTYTGATTISGLVDIPTLANGGIASPLGTNSTVGLLNGGTLNFTGSGSTSDRTFTSDGATSLSNSGTGAVMLSGPLSFVAGGTDTLTFGGSFAGTNTFSGIISGTGNLASTGSTTWLLSGANTRTGTVSVSGGTLQAGDASAFGTVTGVTVSGGTLDLNGFDLSAPTLNGAGGTINLGIGNLTVSGTANSSYGGTIAGDGTNPGEGGLIKRGTGALTLSGANTYTGDTTVNGGTLALDFAAAGAPSNDIISSGSKLVLAGGTVTATGGSGEANSQTFDGLDVTAGSNRITATAGAGGGSSMTINLGAINPTGGLVDFGVSASDIITTTTNVGSNLGGWATVNGSDYAKVDGSGSIIAFTAADYTDEDNAANWNTNGQFISDAAGVANSAYFGTVDNDVQLGGLKYTAANNSTVTIGAGNTLGVDGTILVGSSVGNTSQEINGAGELTGAVGGGTLGVQNSSGTFVIRSTIVDNGGAIGFAKSGAGTVNLTADNTYTGVTTLSGGTLWIGTIADGGVASTLGQSSNASSNLVLESGRLYYSGGTATTDRGFTLVNGGSPRTIEVASGAANLTFTGLVTSPDDAGLTKAGGGTLTLANAANDYIGVTRVENGILSVNTLADGGQVSGIGAATSDSANLVLLNGGTLQYTGGSIDIDRGFTIESGAGRIDVSTAATELTVGGAIVGAGRLEKYGDGTLVLTGTSTYTGITVVNAGTLRAGAALADGSTTGVFGSVSSAMTVNTGAILDLADNSNQIGALNGGGNVTLGALAGTTLTIGGANSGDPGFTGTISGAGNVTHTNGTQVMTGCGNSYEGITTITGAFGGSVLSTDCIQDGGVNSGIGASDSDPGSLVLRNSGILNYTAVAADQTTDRGFTLAAGFGYIQVNDAGTTLEFTGAAVGPGSLIKRGAGTLILAGDNSYSGETRVEGGRLVAGSAGAFDPGSTRLVTSNVAGALFDLNDFDATFTALAGGGTLGGNIDLGAATLTVTNGGSEIFAGAITGTGDLVKNGGGIQGLSGCASDYSGTTTVNQGVLQVTCLADGGTASSIGASGADADNLMLNGGVLRYLGTGSSTDRLFTLGGTSKIEASGSGALVFTSTGPIAFATPGTNQTITLGGTNTANNSLAPLITNNAAGTTSLTKTEAGTWILTNSANTYTGVTSILGGVLGVDTLADGAQASSIGQSSNIASNLVIGTGGTLRYTGDGDTTDRQFTLGVGTTAIESSGTGAIVFDNTGAVSYTGNGSRVVSLGGTYAGDNIMGATIGNQGANVTSLAKSGSGTWVLTGNNTFTGSTVINDGNLVIGNGGTTGNAGTGNVIVDQATSTLSFNRSDTFNFTGTISGPGAIAQIGTGTTVLTATNSIGAARVDDGTLQVNGTLGTATFAMNGDGALAVNGTVEGATAGSYTAFTGDAGGSAITVNSGGTLRGNGDLGGGSDTLSLAGALDVGAGQFNLGDGNDTLVLNDPAVLTGAVVGGTGTDTLQVNNVANRTLTAAQVNGFETLDKTLGGTLTLTGAHDFSAGTTVQAGVLALGDGTTAGSVAGNILNNGQVSFNSPGTQTYAGTISGTGSVVKNGAGTLVLTGSNGYGGTTNINAGTLLVNGDQSAATGFTTVFNGATLGGSGTVGGTVLVEDGGTLSPGNSPGVLTINGDLLLNGGSILDFEFGQADVPGGPFNDLINVGGNLTLDGTLNITQSAGGTFGPGVYRIFNYGGALTNNGLDVASPDHFVQTSVANQVNLVNSAGLSLSFWDGDAGPRNDEIVNGGDGTWRAAGDQNWTDSTGLFAAPFANASFAIFQATAGTVTVDNTNGAVQAVGMQFAADGYVVQGGDLTLVDDAGQAGLQSIIRVGDGTAAGAGYTATIASNLGGATQLVKTDAGTLVLSGVNTYTGGTAINGGTLRISADANLGDAAGGLSLNGGTLNTTADLSSNRAIDFAGAGTFLTDTGTTLTLNGVVSGPGALTKAGGGVLALSAANTYAGGTTITAGTLQLGSGGTAGSVAGDVLNNGILAFNRSDTSAFGGIVSGTGALNQIGTGTTVLTGANSYTGGTTITAGTLQLGNGGTTGSIVGDVVNNAALAFDRSDEVTFAGIISGTGSVEQAGSGTTILTGSNSYTGATTVSAGTLLINGDQSAATGTTSVASGAILGGIGAIGGDVVVADGATLAPGDASGPGALTIAGDLTLAGASRLDYQFGASDIVGGPLNDLTEVGGDLTLDGTIDVTVSPGGSFDVGVYRVISYGGTLTDNTLELGTLPAGILAFVQTSVAGQVNLVNATGTTLNFWDGAAGPKVDGFVNGGDGTWQNSTGNNNWTEATGALNAAFTDAAFAIFSADAGTVTVDNSLGAVSASGMQFASDGYVITGGDLTLVGPQSVVRVGDGTADGLGYATTIGSALTGTTQLVKTDLGTLVLTGTNTYTGGTRINGGMLRIASDANLGAVAGGLSFDGGTLNTTADITSSRNLDLIGAGTSLTDAGTTLTFVGAVSGAGALTKTGTGTLVLAGTGGYTGGTTVAAGSLFVNGNLSGGTGLTSVASGATLGGTGTIGGDVTLADGATLAPGAGGVGTLTIAGDLNLGAGTLLGYEFGQANAAGGALNDLVNIGGDLVLDGTIDVTVPAGGSFGAGVYRVFNYAGALTDNGLTLGSLPVGSDVAVQTAIAGQVNLVNTAGLTLSFWDGDAGPKNNSAIDGGNGVWRVGGGSNNWTEATGAVNADYMQDSFAVFTGTAGTVTVDDVGGNVSASGLQFAVDGYTITGDALTLTGAQSTIRVGDGTAAGASYTATIDSAITGSAQLVKTDAGTLVLTGANSYTGGTAIDGGMVSIASDTNLGAAAGGLSLNGGTFNTTADLSSGRSVNLVGAGTLLTDAGTTLTLTGATSGGGALTKSGTGTLVFGGTGGHTGATSVNAGTLLVNGNYAGATGATSVASGASLGGTGTIGGDVSLADGAILTPGAGGTGTLAINGDLSLAAGTTLAYEFGAANVAGGTLNDLVNVGGDLVLDGTIDVTVPAGGAFDVGVYRVFNYGGTLTNNGLTLGALPAGSDVAVQTSVADQVNLVNTAGLVLNFWDGAAGPKNNDAIDGGNGTWQASGGNDNWTDANGTVNAAYDDGAFAIFGGTGGTITVDNSLGQVTAAGMQFAASGYTISGGEIALTGPQSTIRVGDGSAAGSGFLATLNSALGGATQLVKTDAGTLVLGGANTYTGGTLVTGGTVQIAADANLGAAAGEVTLDGGTLATSATMSSARDIVMAGAGTISTASGTTFTYEGLFSGTGALAKAGAGTLLVTGDNAGYTGATTVSAGTLAVLGTLGSAVAVNSGARLEGTGTVGSVANSGVVAPGGDDGFGTLTVTGSYAGADGTLEIETVLGGDASQTDRLVVAGGTSGATRVTVINTGGLGAQTVEGIKIVDVTGGASDGLFTLEGDYDFEGSPAVIAGAFGYRLFQGGVATPADGDWYLRSALLDGSGQPSGPLYQPGVPLYESYTATLQTLNGLSTLQERVGNRQWSGFTQGGVGMWSRIEGARLRPQAATATSGADVDTDTWGLQAGLDKALHDSTAGTLIAGVNGRYGNADARVHSQFGNGVIETDGFGVGATLTWYGSGGLYADAQAQLSWFDSNLASTVLGSLAGDSKGSGEAFSLEIGQRLPIGASLSLTPQGQIVYSNVKFDTFVDPHDAAVSTEDGDSLRGRLGFSLDHEYSWAQSNGGTARNHVYGIVNLDYEMLDGSRVDVSGTPLLRRDHRLWGELGAGISHSWKDGRFTVFSEISANTALADFGDSNSLRANAGFRMKF